MYIIDKHTDLLINASIKVERVFSDIGKGKEITLVISDGRLASVSDVSLPEYSEEMLCTCSDDNFLMVANTGLCFNCGKRHR